ncbi:MAG: hypothetical protein HQL94_05475 [Magnetococcales bacterium]|nr:hypothetical protein [Magnetococcales bacterium]
MIKYIQSILILFILYHSAFPAFALEVAPRLTDREIIESLTELKQGQKNLEKHMDDMQQNLSKRIEEVNLSLNKRIDEVNLNLNKRIDEMYQNLDKRIDEGNQNLNKRLDELRMDFNKRMDNNHQTMLAMFGTLITLIVTLFGYIAWDRRTMIKPLQEKLNTIENQQIQLTQDTKNAKDHLHSLLEALRALAREDEKLASVMRSFALL